MPLFSCSLSELTAHPKAAGNVACTGAGNGPTWPRWFWQVTWQHCEWQEQCDLFKSWVLWKKKKKKNTTKFAYNEMHFKIKTINSYVIFSSFAFAWSKKLWCLEFPLNAFWWESDGMQGAWQPLQIPPCTTSSVGGVSSAHGRHKELANLAHQVLVCKLCSTKWYQQLDPQVLTGLFVKII